MFVKSVKLTLKCDFFSDRNLTFDGLWAMWLALINRCFESLPRLAYVLATVTMVIKQCLSKALPQHLYICFGWVRLRTMLGAVMTLWLSAEVIIFPAAGWMTGMFHYGPYFRHLTGQISPNIVSFFLLLWVFEWHSLTLSVETITLGPYRHLPNSSPQLHNWQVAAQERSMLFQVVVYNLMSKS